MKIYTKNTLQNLVGRRGKKLLHRRAGITLIELVVVVAILGTLIAIFAGGIGEQKNILDSKTKKLQFQQDAIKVRTYLDEYRNEFGSYPGEDQGLRVLFEQVPGAPENWHRIAKEKNLQDPYKNLYHYTLDENGQPVIISLGQDGKIGGTGENADQNLNDFE